MSTGLIGRKLGMTRVFIEDGSAVPVTVIQAGPCPVVQVREGAVQLGFGSRRRAATTKAVAGHGKKAGLDAAAVCGNFPRAATSRATLPSACSPRVKPWRRAPEDRGSKHRAGSGGGGPTRCGNTRHRAGSIGPGTDPSRWAAGAGPSNRSVTPSWASVVRVDADRNLLFVRGHSARIATAS
jgi:large subunit ribosomal protein L3